MKRSLRLCLIFVLSLALPFSGMAGVQAAEPCPMQVMGMAMMGEMGMDCCNDMQAPPDHGKPCKPGQECKTGGMLQVLFIKAPLTLSRPVVRALTTDFLPVPALAGVWRPPRV